jgi:hypothetical protein
MRHRLLALLAAALATALIAAGCGGDDDEETSGEDFVTQVTEACDEAGAQLTDVAPALQEAIVSGDTEQVGAAVEDDLVPVYESLQSDLDGLAPPDEDADTWDQLLANLDETISLIQDQPEEYVAAAGGEQNDVTQRAEELEAESDQLASELGVPVNCGEPGGGATGPTGAEGSG